MMSAHRPMADDRDATRSVCDVTVLTRHAGKVTSHPERTDETGRPKAQCSDEKGHCEAAAAAGLPPPTRMVNAPLEDVTHREGGGEQPPPLATRLPCDYGFDALRRRRHDHHVEEPYDDDDGHRADLLWNGGGTTAAGSGPLGGTMRPPEAESHQHDAAKRLDTPERRHATASSILPSPRDGNASTIPAVGTATKTRPIDVQPPGAVGASITEKAEGIGSPLEQWNRQKALKNDEQHACPVCQKSFVNRSSTVKHIVTQHMNEGPPYTLDKVKLFLQSL